MYDTLIIGAGMSGLAAGIRLAYYDQRVCILEQHYSIGGLNSFYHPNILHQNMLNSLHHFYILILAWHKVSRS